MRRTLALSVIGAVTVPVSAFARAPSPHLGHAPSALEVKRAGVTVFPNGAGLPSGSGTVAQGERLFQDKCAVCHGEDGQGTRLAESRLVGGYGTLRSSDPILTIGSYWPYATSIWDYIHRAMPYPQPGSLSANEIYAITAFLLYKNDIIGKAKVMNRKTLPEVPMPNRNGFVRYAGIEVRCLKKEAAATKKKEAAKIARTIPRGNSYQVSK